MERNPNPEGISVRLDASTLSSDQALAVLDNQYLGWGLLAAQAAATQYPGHVLTGRVLYIGLNDLGPGVHEIVLQVEA